MRGTPTAVRGVVLALTLVTPALAARLPDWAKPIAESAPPIDPGVPKVPARVLFGETRVTVQADGSFRIRRRFATQALSARAESVGLGSFSFAQGAKIKTSKAWHVPPGEKAEKSYGGPIDVTLSDDFLTDSRARLVKVEGVRRGSLVFFEFESIDTPVSLTFQNLFFDDAPVALERFEIEVPPGWSVRHGWLRRAGPEPQRSGDTLTWEMRDLPAPVREPMGGDPGDDAPLLYVGVIPPAGTSVPPFVPSDWGAVSSWFQSLAAGREAVTPGIAAAAQKVYEQAGPGFYERVWAAARFVRDRVRYVAREVGVGGYQPRPATEVLGDLTGDCKDKGTLFRAILAAGGLPSYPILINSVSPATVSESIPSPAAFNHFVVGIPLPQDTAPPAGAALALVDAGDLGRLLIVDTTDEYLSPGSLSIALAGKKGFVLAEGKSRLVDFPAPDPSAHRIETRLDIEVLADRSIRYRRTSRFVGEPAAIARRAYRQSSLERRKEIEGEVSAEWPGARPEEYSTEAESADGAFLETISWTVPPPRETESATLVPLFPDALDGIPRVPLTRRETAVRYDFPRTLVFETSLKGAAESALRPLSQEQSGTGWSVAARCERKDDAIQGKWQLVLSRARYDPESFGELKQLWAASGKAASAAVPVEAASP